MSFRIHAHIHARAACAALLALLCALQLLCLLRAPAAWSPAAISLKLAAGGAMTIGQRELAAPQADNAHLALRRDAAGDWWLRNASATRQLLLQRDGVERRLGAMPLAGGQSFQIGAASFTVSSARGAKVELNGLGQRWQYDGATVYRDGSAQPPCPDSGYAARMLALWNRAAPLPLTIARPLSFGGNLFCGNRLGVAGVAGASASVARVDGQLVLASAAGEAQATPLLVGAGGKLLDLAQSEQALKGVGSLVAGRTRLVLHLDGDTLELRPQRHVALYAAPQTLLPPGVNWQWQRRPLWVMPGGGAWLVALALATLIASAAALCWQRGAWPFVRETTSGVRAAALASLLLAVAGILAMLLQRSGSTPGVAWSMLLGWAALWGCLLVPGRLTLATGAAVLLLAAGLLAQLEMGLGGMESSWLRHYQKTVALLAIGAGIGIHLRLRGASLRLPQQRLEWLLAMLALAALAALLLQVVLGDETGVFDLQPVEFAKLALTALSAHCLALGLGRHAAMPARWLRLAAPALIFAALLALALVEVDDFSPLILLLVWSMSMAMAWALATGTHKLGAALLVVACLGGSAIAMLRGAGAGEIAQWGFYADRFLVWLEPAQHPHTGQQLLAGARAIAEGAWWGADNWLGIASLGQGAGEALRIPAVQDDFAPSFFLNRHGLLSALFLWSLQALFVIGLLQTAARAYAWSEQARDFRQAWLGRFRCFALCGGAAFVLGHFLLSWGTNLAIFPIMGQPMSFLSAGGSHLLFFICPLLAFHAISAQSIEESQHAGLRTT